MTTANHIEDTASAATAANENATNTATSFVITGFGPFGGVEENPTTVIVRRLDSYLRSVKTPVISLEKSVNDHDDGDDITTGHKTVDGSVLADLVKEYVVLETSAQAVNETMDRIRRDCTEAAASKDQRILLLHLGVARSEGFRLELCAYNEATFRIPDQRSYQPNKEPIVSDSRQPVGHCYETSLDLKGLEIQMKRDFPSVTTVISTNPGRFVCNYVYCKSLEVSLPYSTRKQKQKYDSEADSEPTTVALVEAEALNTPTNDSFAAISGGKNESSTVQHRDKDKGGSNLLCESLFLHVPHFAKVPEEEQLAYVASLLKYLAAAQDCA